jgi:hypothetical protein
VEEREAILMNRRPDFRNDDPALVLNLEFALAARLRFRKQLPVPGSSPQELA